MYEKQHLKQSTESFFRLEFFKTPNNNEKAGALNIQAMIRFRVLFDTVSNGDINSAMHGIVQQVNLKSEA